MDSEVCVLLEELVEASNRPDWWTIVITVVNAVIMTWLGISQYKLQKRQTDAQEYELYRSVYLLINDVQTEIDEFLTNLLNATWEPISKDKDFLRRKKKYIDSLRDELSSKLIDYKLKFSRDDFNPEAFRNILSLMSAIIQHTIMSLEKGEVEIVSGSYKIYYGEVGEDMACAETFAARYSDEMMRNMVMGGLIRFINQKQNLYSYDQLLSEIEKKFKVK